MAKANVSRWKREASEAMGEPVLDIAMLIRRRPFGWLYLIGVYAAVPGVFVLLGARLTSALIYAIPFISFVAGGALFQRTFIVRSSTRVVRVRSAWWGNRPREVVGVVTHADLVYTDPDKLRVSMGGQSYTVCPPCALAFDAIQDAAASLVATS